MPLRLDYTNMMADVVRGGVSASDWENATRDFPRVYGGLRRRQHSGDLGFLELPGNAALHRQSTDFATRTRGQFDDIVVLGIGGSALGPIALRTCGVTSMTSNTP